MNRSCATQAYINIRRHVIRIINTGSSYTCLHEMEEFMKKLLALFLICITTSAWGSEKVDLLWNAGPTNRCFGHVQQSAGHDVVTEFRQNDDCPQLSQRSTTPSCASFGNNGYCPFWNVITYGWDISQKDQYPGWSLSNVAGGWGTPLEIALINNAYGLSDSCDLHEVSFSWEWPDVSFKRTFEGGAIRMGDLSSLEVAFSAKVSNITPPTCPLIEGKQYPTEYVSQDVVVHFPNSSVAYSIGILVYNQNNMDLNQKDDEIFYTNRDTVECTDGIKCQPLLHGNRLAPSARYLNKEGFQFNQFEFLEYFKSGKYLPAPPNGSWDDAMITHVQVVNHARGGNLTVSLKDQQVHAVPSSNIHSIKCHGVSCFVSTAE